MANILIKHICIISFSIIFIQLSLYLLFGTYNCCDSDTLHPLTNYLSGKNGFSSIPNKTMLRPLGPTLYTPFVFFLNTKDAFAFGNLVFSISCAILFYFYSNMILKNSKYSLFSSFCFLTSLPILRFTLAEGLVEMVLYFFWVLSLFLIIRYYFLPKKVLSWQVALIGLVSGFSILIKESFGVVFLIFLIYMILKKGRVELNVLVFYSLFFFLPILANSILIYVTRNFTYLQWFILNLSETYYHFSIQQILFRIFISFTFLWLPTLFAISRFEKDKKSRPLIYPILLSTLLPILIWPYPHDRMIFMLFPSIIPLSVIGLKIYSKKMSKYLGISTNIIEVGFVIMCFILNYCFLFLTKYLGIEFLSLF